MKQNVFTGDNNNFYNNLKTNIQSAEKIDIIVSFLMESGVKLLINDLIQSNKNRTQIRILTSDYLKITQPQALYLLKKEIPDVSLHFYNNPNKSFHPKSYIFHKKEDSEIYVGSSNLSRGALTDSIEWNYHFTRSNNEEDFNRFYETFEDLFNNHSIEITDEVLREYSRTWIKPKMFKKDSSLINNEIEPREAQIEALYYLNKSRFEGYDKALVVAATGVGKTYIAAFDSKKYNKILFIAHRIEIIQQAEKIFKKVHPTKTTGYFYNNKKEMDEDIIFALVQSLGKETYLNSKYFNKDEFDYIIIDEFHHAVANNYIKVLKYFEAEFLLGLTATPERLDNKDVFALCDYNNVYEIRLKEAINKGFLSPFKYYGIYDDTIDYQTVSMKNGKYDEKDLERKLMIHKRAELVLKHYLKYVSKSAIAFCSSKNHAEYMTKYFQDNGISSAAVYSGKQGEYTEKREEAINKLKNNNIRILFTVDMFNEGVDIPSIDTVLFLRPTQSPTIFLQQLGRGLRKDKNKKYLTVLDFIGNYKKANLIPFLLSGKEYDSSTLLKESPLEFEYPEDCYIDFDFHLINIFKKQSKNELKIKDQIIIEYENIKEELRHRPSRIDMFLRMDENILKAMKKSSKLNIFNNYIGFLAQNNELNKEEQQLTDTIAQEFLQEVETTKMTKSYKIPIFHAFYNNGQIKMEINEEDVYEAMKNFYNIKSNGVDMLKDKSSKNYCNWGKKEYVSLAKRNPIKFLNKSSGKYFIKKENSLLALNDELKEYVEMDSFKQHFKDIIEYLTINYYKNRLERKD